MFLDFVKCPTAPDCLSILSLLPLNARLGSCSPYILEMLFPSHTSALTRRININDDLHLYNSGVSISIRRSVVIEPVALRLMPLASCRGRWSWSEASEVAGWMIGTTMPGWPRAGIRFSNTFVRSYEAQSRSIWILSSQIRSRLWLSLHHVDGCMFAFRSINSQAAELHPYALPAQS